MMNPGSSKPLDKKYEPGTFSKEEYFQIKAKELIPAQPDNAQYQVMRLMALNDWDFVRILNLSDLRNGNSGKFQNEFRTAMELDNSNPHCITHTARKQELLNHTRSKSNIVIAAWGHIPELKDSAKVILNLDKNIIGLQNGEMFYYRHASPPPKKYKIEWLSGIQKELNKNNSLNHIGECI